MYIHCSHYAEGLHFSAFHSFSSVPLQLHVLSVLSGVHPFLVCGACPIHFYNIRVIVTPVMVTSVSFSVCIWFEIPTTIRGIEKTSIEKEIT